MAEPIIAQKSPYAVEVVAGRKYFWCACGRSQKQPFCDGAHKDTGITPMAFEATEAKKLFFCGCKQAAKKPFCDGTHNKI
jgi:CDGSH iron-sulfur domain-containing protein 3